MSEAVLNDVVLTETSDQPSFLKWRPVALLLALVGVVASLGLMFNPSTSQYMANSYMFGFIFWILVTFGCLGLSILYSSIKSRWIVGGLRLFEAGSSWQMWAVFFVLLTPILFKFLPDVYEWAKPDAINDPIIKGKMPYLNQPGFIFRAFAFMGILALLSAGLRASNLRQDKSGDEREAQLRTNWGTPGIVLFVLVITFAMTDWGMSLNPHWASTIYGLWLMVGGAQAALSLTTVLICTNASKAPYRDVISPKYTKDLGNMMFVLAMLWAYTSVSQLIIIWNGNLPEFTGFYAHRGGNGLWWNAVGLACVIGCWVVPFVILNSPRVKRYPERLARIAGWIFVFRIIDIFWVIGASLPHRATNTAMPTPYDLLAFFTFGAVWFAVMLTRVQAAPLLVQHDTRLQEDKAHAH